MGLGPGIESIGLVLGGGEIATLNQNVNSVINGQYKELVTR